jgi:hypothetical protein
MAIETYRPISIDRMVEAVERVRQRRFRVVKALSESAIEFAVVGEAASAAWVASVDPEAERNTRDLHLLIRRSDRTCVIRALQSIGLVYEQRKGVDCFVDSGAVPCCGLVKLLFSSEFIHNGDVQPVPALPDGNALVRLDGMPVLALPLLAGMMLSSFRTLDCVCLRDLCDVGLIDSAWPNRYPSMLAARLQHILDTPDG